MDNNIPKPKLKLGNIDGEEGNAFVILGRAQKIAQMYNDFAAQVEKERAEALPGQKPLAKRHPMDWEAIMAEAKSGDYDHLLDTLEQYFDIVATGGRYSG
jgi:hypothetical protein